MIRSHLKFRLFVWYLFVLFLCPERVVDLHVIQGEEFSPENLEFFEKEIRPLLSRHCYSCHSHQSPKLKGKLFLDSRSGLLLGGETGPALVPGKPEASLLIEAVQYDTLQMPPAGKLTEDQIALLEKWIHLGAPWPTEPEPQFAKEAPKFDLAQRKASHWAWQPIQDPGLPPVADSNWPVASLDYFILADLEKNQLHPAPSADRLTVLRRLYFDLIGLPPSFEQLQRHLQDDSPSGLEKVVDELLASPHFGERWGRHWLDLVRYAESRGHEFDSDALNAFQYRDYIIRALNADVPYDQLIREHLAGDLLSPPRLNPEQGFNESILGTGFWFLGEWVHSPVDIRKDETDRFDNMIDVMSKTFLGLTVSCARCHDHKFDAISSKDYYALSGFLQSCNYREVCFESIEQNRLVAQKLATLDHSVQPQLRRLLLSFVESQIPDVSKYLQSCEDLSKGEKSNEAALNALAVERSLNPVLLANWLQVFPTLMKDPSLSLSSLSRVRYVEDQEHRLLFDYGAENPPGLIQDGFVFGLEPIPAGTFIPRSTPDGIQVSVASAGAVCSDPFWKDVRAVTPKTLNQRGNLASINRSGRTFQTPSFPLESTVVSSLVSGTGRLVACVDSHRLVFGPLHGETIVQIKSETPGTPYWVTLDLGRYRGHRLHLEFTPEDNCDLKVFQVWSGPPPAPLPTEGGSQPTLLAANDLATLIQQSLQSATTNLKNEGTYLDTDQAQVLGWVVSHLNLFVPPGSPEDRDWKEVVAKYVQQRNELSSEVRNRSQIAMAMIDGSGENDRLLIRGSSSNPGEEVPRRFLEALDGTAPLTIPSGSGRLQLAERINDPGNPFTARVISNRIWLHLLGRGIVPTPDDFGELGQPPTNVALLDHLATRFVKNGRSLKRLIREIVLSRTYQMSSRVDPHALEKDPKNLLWHHVPPKRLEGEVIRDALLAISGKLDSQMYGEPVPIHLTTFMDGRGRPPVNGPEDGANRRSIYIAVRRNFLSPFMLAFDTPVPFSSMGRRNVSNVPGQALILMNDPFVLSQARAWSDRALKQIPENPAARIQWMYETAFARPPQDKEAQVTLLYLQAQATARGISINDPELWADLAHTLINVKEFIFIM